MENRVTRLEAEFTYVRRDLDEIKDEMKEIRGRLDDVVGGLESVRAILNHKPGKGFVIGTVIAIFGLCAGMVGATVAAMQYLQGHV